MPAGPRRTRALSRALGRRVGVHEPRSRRGTGGVRAAPQSRAARRPPRRPTRAWRLVVRRPLPYLYLARDVLGRAGIPYETRDTLPLAAEPFAAALDLLFEWVTSGFTRATTLAVLRSPHFRFADGDGAALDGAPIVALDRALADARYLGDADRLAALVETWSALPERRRHDHARRALPAARAAADAARSAGAAGHARGRSRAHDGHACSASSIAICGRSTTPTRCVEREARVRAGGARCLPIAGRRRTRRFDRRDRARRHRGRGGGAPLARRADLRAAHRRGRRADRRRRHRALRRSTTRCRSSASSTPTGRSASGAASSTRRSCCSRWPGPRNASASRARGRRSSICSALASRRASRCRPITLEDDAVVEPSAFLHEVRALAPPRQVVAARRAHPHLPVGSAGPRPAGARRRCRNRRATWARVAPVAHRRRRCRRSTATPGRGLLPRISVSRLERYLDCPFKFYAVAGAEPRRAAGGRRQPHAARTRAVPARAVRAGVRRLEGGRPRRHHRGPRCPRRTACSPRWPTRRWRRCRPGDAAIERLRLFGTAGAPGIARRVLAMEVERGGVVVERLLEFDARRRLHVHGARWPHPHADAARQGRSHRPAGRRHVPPHRLQDPRGARSQARAAVADLLGVRRRAARRLSRAALAAGRSELSLVRGHPARVVPLTTQARRNCRARLAEAQASAPRRARRHRRRALPAAAGRAVALHHLRVSRRCAARTT